MNQQELDRAVARVTGESLRQVRRQGFSLVVIPVRIRPCDQRCSAEKKCGKGAKLCTA